MSLQESVNAKVIYGNTTPQVQSIYAIRYINPKHGSWLEGHKDWPACYIGMTRDARTWSHTYVYALNNSGPFYVWFEWSAKLKREELITNFQAVIDKVRAMRDDKSLPAERTKALTDAWTELQISDNKQDAIRRLKEKKGAVYLKVLGYLEGEA